MKINKRVLVKVPASTSNLGPGFDVLGLAFQLYNEVEAELTPQKSGVSKNGALDISIEGEGADFLPRDEQNVIWQSMAQVFKKLKFQTKDYAFKIRFVNRIPLARGLGSSAAASLSGILAANAICGNVLNQQQILQLAVEAEGHPDNVVPQLVGGFCISCMEDSAGAAGKEVRFLKLAPPKGLAAVVCVPEFELSTKKARAVLPKTVALKDAVFNVSRVSFLLVSLMQGKSDLLRLAMQDKLHQNYRKKLVHGYDAVVESARKAGALATVLSGAGPTMLSFARVEDAQKIARAMERGFFTARKKSKSLILKIDQTGSRIF